MPKCTQKMIHLLTLASAMTQHESYMKRCIELARNGAFFAAPNPMVGSVIVHNNTIIGEGYHAVCGQAHAEVNAVNSVKDKSLLKDSTIYVTLEPCAHFGKTPPCSDLIVEMGIPKVVIGCVDSFSEVAGKSIEKLKKAGAEVIVGVLEEECRDLNKRFFTFHEKKRPYVILKWAQTKDGFIDKLPEDKDRKGGVAISGPEAKRLVHTWRAEEQAILVGKNTVLNDNPSLTVREIEGPNPVRIILDSNGSLSKDYKVFDGEVRTIVLGKSSISTQLDEQKVDGDEEVPFTESVSRRINSSRSEQHEEPISTPLDVQDRSPSGVEVNRYQLIQDMSIPSILNELYKQGLTSVFVEGGAKVLQSFIDSGLWDEARVFTADTTFERGIAAPILDAYIQGQETVGKDILTIYIPKA